MNLPENLLLLGLYPNLSASYVPSSPCIPLESHKDVPVSALTGCKVLLVLQKLTDLSLWACKCAGEKKIPHPCLITRVRIHTFTEV